MKLVVIMVITRDLDIETHALLLANMETYRVYYFLEIQPSSIQSYTWRAGALEIVK